MLSNRTTDDIRRAWREANLSPLWENDRAHGKPVPEERTHLWAWETMKPLIDEAAALHSMEVAERRVLSLIDPEPRAGFIPSTVINLNGGLQILKPGESARPHRHTMNALRFVLWGDGATTIVDGKRCAMHEFDLVTTPGWTWHEHEHAGAEPIVWLDVLDANLHRYLGTDRFEPGPVHDLPEYAQEPVFRYPWADAVRALESAAPAPDGTRRHRYVNPAGGGPVMSLLDCYAVEIPAGTTTTPFRTSSHAVCTVVEGRGTSRIGNDTITWGPRDIFSLPDRAWTVHEPAERARFFMTTDREILRRLDLLKEEYG